MMLIKRFNFRSPSSTLSFSSPFSLQKRFFRKEAPLAEPSFQDTYQLFLICRAIESPTEDANPLLQEILRTTTVRDYPMLLYRRVKEKKKPLNDTTILEFFRRLNEKNFTLDEEDMERVPIEERKSGMIKKELRLSLDVADKNSGRSEIPFEDLFYSLARSKLPKPYLVMDLLKKYQEEVETIPDEVYPLLFRTLARHFNETSFANRFFFEMVEKGIELDSDTYFYLYLVHANSGKIEEADKLWKLLFDKFGFTFVGRLKLYHQGIFTLIIMRNHPLVKKILREMIAGNVPLQASLMRSLTFKGIRDKELRQLMKKMLVDRRK